MGVALNNLNNCGELIFLHHLANYLPIIIGR